MLHLKRINTYQQMIGQGISILFLLLALFISSLQLIHSHADRKISQYAEEEHTTTIDDQCHVCDFLVHLKTDEQHFIYPVLPSPPLPQAIVYGNPVCAGNYEFTLQGFTNKGPPRS